MSQSVVRLLPDGDTQSGLKATSYMNPANILEGEANEHGHTFFTNAQSNVEVGVWECTPCLEQIDGYGVDELCTVLSGSVIVTDTEGNTETFRAGDSFVMSKDFRGTWHITETLKKFYMIVAPPGDA